MNPGTSRVIVHLSDLHFGRTDARIVQGLRESVWALQPQLVAVSGDLTQRARRSQFRRARAFLEGLPCPRLVVPGNHDVPLFNFFARVLNPLGGYKRFVTEDLTPTLSDQVVWAIGINTTRPTTWKNGSVDSITVKRVQEALRCAPPAAVKMLVAHHPFDSTDRPGASKVLEELTAAGIDVFLTGHLHVSYTGQTAQRYRTGGRSAIVVEAATATSTRVREEPNGFNVLRIAPEAVRVETRTWDGGRFVEREASEFVRGTDGWTSS